MTRSELIESHVVQLAPQHLKLTAKDIELAAITILDGMVSSLQARGRVEIRGFGSFAINKRLARKGRNPKTGETVMVSAKKVPHFKAGQDLRDRIDYKKDLN